MWGTRKKRKLGIEKRKSIGVYRNAEREETSGVYRRPRDFFSTSWKTQEFSRVHAKLEVP